MWTKFFSLPIAILSFAYTGVFGPHSSRYEYEAPGTPHRNS
ncbi:MAG: hypothetical protein AB1429_03180 [Pseudomonadota bacterium]|jgi:hypothetical protein